MSSGRFDGRTIIVTGAAGGIGEGYARGLADEGANVVVADLNDEAGEKVAADIGGLYVHTDVSDPASAEALAAATVERYGNINGLVNNAAIYGGMKLDFIIVPWDYYKKFMSVNLDGALAVTRAVYPHMKEGGAIVNQSPTAAYLYSGFYGRPGQGRDQQPDLPARHRARRQQHPRQRDRARPHRHRGYPDDHPRGDGQDMVKALPLKRFGTPADHVGMCKFLLSDEASWITGQIFNVDGGQVYRP